jgi:outer membrane protein TolC
MVGLDQALERALAENLVLGLARASEERVQARSSTALGRLAPRLEFGGGVRRTDGVVQGNLGELGDVEFDTINPQVRLVYRVNLPARISDALAASRENEAALLVTRDTRQRTLYRVVALYHEVLLSEAGVQIAQRRVEDRQRFVEIVAARQGAGLGLESEVARARARLARDRQDLAQARALWKAASTRLAVALRWPPEVLLVGKENRLAPSDLTPATAEIEALAARVRQRPDIRSLRASSEAAHHRSSASWWDLLAPEIDLRLDRTYIGEGYGTLDGATQYGVFLGWTLSFDGFGQIQERRAEKRIAELEVLRREEQAVGMARRVLAELEAAREQLPLAQVGLEAAEQNRRISQARFRSGTAIALEVLDAEDQLASARLDLARTIVDFNLTQARLLVVTGEIALDRLRSRL